MGTHAAGRSPARRYCTGKLCVQAVRGLCLCVGGRHGHKCGWRRPVCSLPELWSLALIAIEGMLFPLPYGRIKGLDD